MWTGHEMKNKLLHVLSMIVTIHILGYIGRLHYYFHAFHKTPLYPLTTYGCQISLSTGN